MSISGITRIAKYNQSMSNRHRAILELANLIQSGDVLTFTDGTCNVAVSSPANPCNFMRRETDKGGISSPIRYSLWITAWLVSIQGESCQFAVKLYAIMAVERDGREVWNIEDERIPVQKELL